MNKNQILNSVISATAGGILGGVVTYLTVKKTFEARANEDVRQVKEHYALIRKDDGSLGVFGEVKNEDIQIEIPEERIEAAKKVLESLQYAQIQSEEVSKEDEMAAQISIQESRSIFNEYDSVEPVDDTPFVISQEQFFTEETHYDKTTIVWYEGGDGHLVDERDQLIDNVDYLIGEKHLQMFGEQSEDSNIVYVRNNNISTDFEVIRHQGRYEVVVLGVDPKYLDDDSEVRVKRMRDED